jgi:tetratricopeptide (TPR) repeat protein
MTGDTKSLKEVIGGESKASQAVNDAIAIGSRAGSGSQTMGSAAPTPAKTDDAQDLRKLGMQFQALITQADKSKALEIGRRYIGLLLKERNEAEAVKIFKECIAADPAFRLAQAEEVLPMAKAARAGGDPQTAVAALRGFDKAYPGHGLIPEVFVFSAKLMAEDLRNNAMARKILQHVVEKYPGHYIAQEAKRYLQAMPQSA